MTQNQIDLYDALAGTHSPVMKPNELVGVRVVESEGPLKGQLELKFEHDLPNGTCTFTHTYKEHTQTTPNTPTSTRTCMDEHDTHAHNTVIHQHALTRYGHTRTRTHARAHDTVIHAHARTQER